MKWGITYYRLWCKECQDWKLFDRKKLEIEVPEGKEDYEYTCRECGTPHVDILLGDIPKEKLEEQRARYNTKRKGQYTTLMREFTMDPEARQVKELLDMFGPPASSTDIYESDAGQKKLDEIAQMKRQREIEEKEARKREIINECVPFKNMARNDQCACGSGKKYKKCCMDKIEGYLLKYNLSFKSYK